MSAFSIAGSLAPEDHADGGNVTEAGKAIFLAQRLSADGSTSCASCHRPDHAFTDGMAVSKGIAGLTGTRNTPSLLNAARNGLMFWDGRRESVESMILDPLLNPAEHGLADEQAVLGAVKDDVSLAVPLAKAFGLSTNQLEIRHIVTALASYVQSLSAADSSFDGSAFKSRADAIATPAQRGFQLFTGRAQCASCHDAGGDRPSFTDHQFHSNGVSLGRIQDRLPALTKKLLDARQAGTPLGHLITSDRDIAELGRYAVTLEPADIGKFKTPSLLNVAVTPPYMHDGSLATLEEAVEHEVYYRSVHTGRVPALSPQDKADLVAFLRALTDAAYDIKAAKPTQGGGR